MTVTIKDLVNNNLCTGCGLCVSESSASLKMEWDNYGFLVPYQIKDEVPEQAITVCPFNIQPEKDIEDEDKLAAIYLQDATHFDENVGRFENTYAGYSIKYRPTSSSGGIGTYIFEELLRKKIVTALFIVKEINNNYAYHLFDSVESITEISKTRYIPVTLDTLFTQIENIDGKVAISGVACFIKAIRLKQHYHPELKDKIPFLTGIICGGLKSRFFTDFLAQSAGIIGEYHLPQYRIKDKESSASDYSFGAFDVNDHFHTMKMQKVGDMWGTGLFKSRACDFCTDVLTELADISLGDAWLPEYRQDGLGTSIIVTRSKIADKLIKEGIANGKLNVSLISKEKIILSQKPSFAHRRDAIKFRITLSKWQGKLTPHIRKRVQQSISIYYGIVQLQREQTRRKSIEYWHKEKDIVKFKEKIKFDLKKLALLTRIYHKLRK